ncbi:hypothetical protein MKW92_003322 [Papaver armeniacum]|nr:hypothetical protein MKW92_003322 [Papaver armeniacum]
MGSKETYRNELRTAIRQLSDRCLYSASKWAAEQLVGIEQDPAKFTPSHTRFQRGSSSIRRRFGGGGTNEPPLTPLAGVSYISTPIHEEDDNNVDNDFYLLAKSYFDCKEYRRAAHVLRDQTGKKLSSCEEEVIELDGSLGKSDAVNNELVSLERELSAQRKNGTIDPFGLYLYGVVLKEKGRKDLARTVLVESVNNYPWNWSAWSELQCLCTTNDILKNLDLKNHWMKDFFLGSAFQELRMHTDSLARYEHLQRTFRFSNYIQAQIAKAQTLINDPYRVEDMDMYSNVLYAKECFSALSYLAHRVFLTDKYRPESCCIIGNYYSLKGQHEKSRAVDINPCDYRAWYGLGQAYEMMCMPFYALYYFRKSVYLQPSDSRLWIAMAQCYETEQLHMLEEAIKCYERAANCNDREAIALHQLAKLHQELGRSEKAAFYYEKDLERMEAEERDGPNMVEALLFLATHCRAEKRFREAEIYCTRLWITPVQKRKQQRVFYRGMKIAQSGYPPMDTEHFPP